MTVLVVTNRYPPDAEGGYENSCALVVQALRERGHRVAVVTRKADSAPAERETFRVLSDRNSGDRKLLATGWVLEARDRVHFGNILDELRAHVAYIWGASGLSLRVLSDATRRLPTVVYVADYWLANWLSNERLPDGFAHQISALARRPVVRSYRLNRVINCGFAWLDARMYRGRMAVSPTIVQFDSQYMVEDLARRSIVVADGRVTPHAIDVSCFSFLDPDQRQDRTPRVLFVGRLVPEKGVETLVRAIPLLRERMPATVLTLVGPVDPEYERALRALTTRLGVHDAVTVLGPRARDELDGLYRSHTVLAFPSEWDEPFGIVLLEAMASGLPIVSSAAGGSSEIVTDGVTGLVFERGSSVDLADKLATALSSPTLRSEFARQARAVVEQRYDIAVMADQVERDLGAAIARHGRPLL